MAIPKLRFTKFVDTWKTKKLGEISKVTSGGTPSRTEAAYWAGDIPWVTTSLIDFDTITDAEEYITEKGLKNSSAKIFPKGTLLVALYGQGVTRGKVAILGIEATTNQACAAVILDDTKLQIKFGFYCLQSKYHFIRNLANDGGQKNLSGELVKNIPISFPELEEQTKIADFLSAVDDKIRLLKAKHALLQQYKKGVMQKLFNQEIRFKDDSGQVFPDWELLRVKDVTSNFSKRNKNLVKADVYSVTNDKGFVLQSEQFDKQIAGEDLSNYKVITTDNFAYNPARINVGSIAQFKGEIGVISSLYVCFKVKPKLSDLFFNYWLQLDKTKFDINRFGEGGVRSYLWYPLFSRIQIQVPCKEEQIKIAEFLQTLDKKLDAVQQQIDLTQTFKKGLLQQMFV